MLISTAEYYYPVRREEFAEHRDSLIVVQRLHVLVTTRVGKFRFRSGLAT